MDSDIVIFFKIPYTQMLNLHRVEIVTERGCSQKSHKLEVADTILFTIDKFKTVFAR